MLLALLVAAATAGLVQDDSLRLVFLDVGQGEAIVIRSPEGKAALVDAGPPGVELVERLRGLGIDSLDLVVATHPHADHIGAMADVIRSLPVRYYMDNGVPHTTRSYEELVQSVRESDVVYLQATARVLRLGGVTLTVLPPPVQGSSHNNRSIGLLLEFGEFRALLTGDSEVEELNHWLARGVPEVTVLKAAHHGSRDAVSPGWLSATSPEVVVISCGQDNEYGYPHPWALRYYETVAERVYRTDLHGDVIVESWADGEYKVTTTGRREGGGSR